MGLSNGSTLRCQSHPRRCHSRVVLRSGRELPARQSR